MFRPAQQRHPAALLIPATAVVEKVGKSAGEHGEDSADAQQPGRTIRNYPLMALTAGRHACSVRTRLSTGSVQRIAGGQRRQGLPLDAAGDPVIHEAGSEALVEIGG